MKKASVIGHFGEGLNLANGQTIKTKIVTSALKEELGEEEVVTFDTHGGAVALLKAPFQCLSALRKSENVIIFPAHNGLRVYPPLLSALRHLYKNRKLHYVVIGGWLPEFLMSKKSLKRKLLKFDGIYVETSTMKRALEEQGFRNIYVMPNFKDLAILEEKDLVYPTGVPFRLVTFSRVNRMKGIEDAVNAVRSINEEIGYTAYSLDIYGSIDEGEEEWFSSLKESFPDYISYKGVVPYGGSVDVLKDYFALLFPTRYLTEGIPGTILDAYASGLPVLASRWENYDDIIEEGKTGLGYPFGEEDGLKKLLLKTLQEPKKILDMKGDCVRKAKEYRPDEASAVLLDNLRGGYAYEFYPLRLCTFSRVTKEKGIEDAVSVVKRVNEKLGYLAFTLDIYGSVSDSDQSWFESLQKGFPNYIRYKGVVDSSRSVDVLKGYYALLFPTFYPGEGFAGTLIDAFSSGLPVIASDWRYNREVVNERVGILYPTKDNDALETILLVLAKSPTRLLEMKKACLEEARRYEKKEAMKVLLREINAETIS